MFLINGSLWTLPLCEGVFQGCTKGAGGELGDSSFQIASCSQHINHRLAINKPFSYLIIIFLFLFFFTNNIYFYIIDLGWKKGRLNRIHTMTFVLLRKSFFTPCTELLNTVIYPGKHMIGFSKNKKNKFFYWGGLWIMHRRLK